MLFKVRQFKAAITAVPTETNKFLNRITLIKNTNRSSNEGI